MNNHVVSDKNNEHTLNIWKTFKMNTMKDYHVLYFKVDILLLDCVFQTFIKETINSFELDPAHYLSTPDYSWDAVLRFNNVNLNQS